jgi:hypothetical protein
MLVTIDPACQPEEQRAIVFDDDWEWFLSRGSSVTDEELAERDSSLALDDPINLQRRSCCHEACVVI